MLRTKGGEHSNESSKKIPGAGSFRTGFSTRGEASWREGETQQPMAHIGRGTGARTLTATSPLIRIN